MGDSNQFSKGNKRKEVDGKSVNFMLQVFRKNSIDQG